MSSPAVSSRSAIVAFSLGALFFGYAFIQRVAPSIMTTELMRDFAVGGAALGSLSAFYFWTYASIQLPVGILTDRFGPRKLMSVAAAICAVAAAGFAFSESLIAASFWRAIIGGTVAFGFVGTLAIVSYWFRHSAHAALTGVLQAVGMLGAVFAQGLMRPLVEENGWRSTMTSLAVVALVIAVLVYFLVPKRSQEQKKVEVKTGIFDGLKVVASNSQSWLCALIGFGAASTMLSFSGLWAVPWLSTVHGYTPTQAAQITTTLFLGWAVFSPFVGWGSDLIGRRNPIMVVGLAGYTIGLFIMLYFTPSTTITLMLLMFIIGGCGSVMTIGFVAVKEHNAPQHASTSIGLMNMMVVGSGALMQPLIGWLLDQNWDGVMLEGARVYSASAYSTALSSLLVVNVAAFIGTLLLKETGCKQLVK